MQPNTRPAKACFSSGPCTKHPGWSPTALGDALVGRSHRSGAAKARLRAVIDRSAAMLGLPDDWRLAIVPGSDTGAFEMAMWSLLGPRGVDALVWDSFGAGWVGDVVKQLRLPDVRTLEAPYGALPDLGAVDPARDLVFVWNGTTSGVRVPHADWIAADREGLAICDATSAVFAMPLDWHRLDAVTWSWQKALGGEAAHGMLALGPRAVDRLLSYTPPWPMPKLFRMTKGGALIESLFRGETINTPSMLCVEDLRDALDWADEQGGLSGLISRAGDNLQVVADWVAGTDWADFLAGDPATRSPTSICLKIVDSWFAELDEATQRAAVKRMVGLLETENVAYDIGGYRDAPPGLRLWGGATVERADLAALLPWLDWAFGEIRADGRLAAE